MNAHLSKQHLIVFRAARRLAQAAGAAEKPSIIFSRKRDLCSGDVGVSFQNQRSQKADR
jgi:hypothetical protein